MTDLFFEKISKELTLNQLWKNGIWLQTQVAAKRLSTIQIEYLRIHVKLLEEIYPGKWDILIIMNSNRGEKYYFNKELGRNIYNIRKGPLSIIFQPIIHFENITIQNTRKQFIPIKSIFVKLDCNFYKDRYQISTILGARNILSYNEYSNGYLHSHLPTTSLSKHDLYFQHFCLGTGEIRMMFSKLSNQFNEGLFKTILFHIEGYLKWESLEGAPYIKLEKLFLKNKNDGIEYLSSIGIREYVDLIRYRRKRDRTTPKLDWYIEDNYFKIKDNEKLEEYCKWEGNYIYNYDSEYRKLFYYKDEIGNYYSRTASIEEIEVNTECFIPFKGEKHKIQIEGVLDNLDNTIYIHPKIKLNVKRQIEIAINNRAIKYHAINAL